MDRNWSFLNFPFRRLNLNKIYNANQQITDLLNIHPKHSWTEQECKSKCIKLIRRILTHVITRMIAYKLTFYNDISRYDNQQSE
jgi:hypothetical protein